MREGIVALFPRRSLGPLRVQGVRIHRVKIERVIPAAPPKFQLYAGQSYSARLVERGEEHGEGEDLAYAGVKPGSWDVGG